MLVRLPNRLRGAWLVHFRRDVSMARDACTNAILKAVVAAKIAADHVVEFYTSIEISATSLTGFQAIISTNRLALHAGSGEGGALG